MLMLKESVDEVHTEENRERENLLTITAVYP